MRWGYMRKRLYDVLKEKKVHLKEILNAYQNQLLEDEVKLELLISMQKNNKLSKNLEK